MEFNELPQEVQQRLLEESKNLSKKNQNTAYRISLYNPNGTRHFFAIRKQLQWSDDKGNYMPYGGGSYWYTYYYVVGFKAYKDVLGEIDYKLVDSVSCKNVILKNGEKVQVKGVFKTKSEVLELVKKIGFTF